MPRNLKGNLRKRYRISKHETRQKNDLQIPRVRLEISKRNLYYFGARVFHRVFFKVLTGGTFVRVGPFACPSSEGKITTFTSVDQVKMGPFFNFLGKQTNAIDDASHFVNDLLVAAVFVVNSYRRKIGGPLCCFSHQSKSLKIPWCSKRYMDFGINQPFKKSK